MTATLTALTLTALTTAAAAVDEDYSSQQTSEEMMEDDSAAAALIPPPVGVHKKKSIRYANDDDDETIQPAPKTLNFQKVQFFGRKPELKQMKDVYTSTMNAGVASSKAAEKSCHNRTHGGDNNSNNNDNDSTTIPAVFLWGPSGTGKTCLVHNFADNLGSKSSSKGEPKSSTGKPYLLKGKHDESSGKIDPFSAIVDTLNDFVRQVRQGPEAEQDRIRGILQTILASSGNDSAIVKLVPSLNKLMVPSSGETQFTNGRLSAVQDDDARDNASGSGDSDESSYFSGSRNSASIMRMDLATQAESSQSDNAWNRLQYAFVSFIRAISTKEHPVIMFLDDLQWISSVGMDLLSTLLSDKELKYFLFVGTIRQEINPHTNEVLELNPTSPLANMLQSFQEGEQQDGVHPVNQFECPKWTDIVLSNICKEDVSIWLSQLLARDVEDLDPLTSKIFAKTEGNIFFTLQLLEQLEHSKAIFYNSNSNQWEWNWSDDSEHNHAFENGEGHGGAGMGMGNSIVALISMKLRQHSVEVQTTLAIASYVRFSFDIATLQAIVEMPGLGHILPDEFATSSLVTDNSKTGDANGQPCDMASMLAGILDEAVLSGLLTNTVGDVSYRFAHDRVQQASHELIPFGEPRQKLRQLIGRCILNLCCPGLTAESEGSSQGNATGDAANENNENDEQPVFHDRSLLFVAADHLNSVPTKDHLFLIKLNLEIGELAKGMAALEQSAVYLQLAYESLGKIANPWEERYELTHRLFQSRVDVELCKGNFELGYEMGRTILKNSKTLEDKIPTYMSMASALARQDKNRDSLIMHRSAAQMLKKFPKRNFIAHIVKDMLAVKRYFKRHTDQAVLRLPLMTDKRTLLALRFMSQLVSHGYVCQMIADFVLAVMKILRLSMKYGLTEDTGYALGAFAIITSAMGDQENAVRLSNLSKKIMKKTKSKLFGGYVHDIWGRHILAWDEPIEKFVDGYYDSYRTCMSHGEFHLGFTTWSCSLILLQGGGYPLAELYQSHQSLLGEMALYKFGFGVLWTKEHSRLSSIMTEQESLDWESIRSYGQGVADYGGADSIKWTMGYWVYLQLAVYFMQYDIAEELIKRLDASAAKVPDCNLTTARLLYRGIAAAAKYRETGKNKYLKRVMDLKSQSQKLCRTKGNSGLNRLMLLRAELLTLSSKKGKNNGAANGTNNEVLELYKTSITLSTASRKIHDTALACELAGEYILREGGNKTAASSMFMKSCENYLQWGATAKVKDLKQKHAEFIDEELLAAIDTKRLTTDTRIAAFDDKGEELWQMPNYMNACKNSLGNSTAGPVSATPQSVMVGSTGSGPTSSPTLDTEDDDLSVLTDMS